jgi:hypothetical protein
MTQEDSFKVTMTDDGELTLEWNPEDPRNAIFNNLTEEQLQQLITDSLTNLINEIDDNA